MTSRRGGGTHGRPQTAKLVLPVLKQVIDDATSRAALTRHHQPQLILPLMILSLLMASLIGGMGMARSSRLRWVHVLAFVVVTTAAVVTTYDLEYPRSGFIRIDVEDQVIVDLRKSFDAP